MTDVLQAVDRAARRSSALVHEEMRAGLCGLATIACLAPWVGVLGTLVYLPTAFPGFAGQREAILAYMAEHLGQAMSFTALGILVGLIGLWSYRYLKARLETLDLEMESASVDLLNQLSRFPVRFRLTQTVDAPRFGEVPIAQVEREARIARRLRLIACVAIVGACWLEGSRVASLLGLSCLFVYPVWVKLLRRRPGGLVLLGSLLCLLWTGAELLLNRSLP
jgi:hypothetical protein